MSRSARYLVVAIRQVDGGSRRIYMRTRREAEAARAEIRRDPTMIDAIGCDEYVDVDRVGNSWRYVLDGAS